MYKLTFKGRPVSVNHTYRAGKGRYFKDKNAVAYEESIKWQALAQWKNLPLSVDLDVTFKFYFEDKRRRDHLNYNKILADSLNGIVWNDDRQIIASHHYTYIDKNDPRVEIIIKLAS